MLTHTFPTHDLNIAAFCLSQGGRLLRIERGNPKCQFLIVGEMTEQEATDRYWDNEKVSVLDFVTAQKRLKQQLYS